MVKMVGFEGKQWTGFPFENMTDAQNWMK
jgi:hypothetical protein